jgi:hypothetical protein
MPKNDGVYGNTKRGLVESGAMEESDFDYENTSAPASNSRPGSVTSRQADSEVYKNMYKKIYKQGGYK